MTIPDWVLDVWIVSGTITALVISWWEGRDTPRFLMNKSKAWIVERYVPEGHSEPAPFRIESRYRKWRREKRLKSLGKPLDKREAHWRIVRPTGDVWEDVRRRDRMVLECAMTQIKTLLVSPPLKNVTLRLRNIKTGDILMGDILKVDILMGDILKADDDHSQYLLLAGRSGGQAIFGGGVHHTKI